MLCTVQSHLDEQFVQFSGLGCHSRPVSLCVEFFVLICVYFVFLFRTAYVLYYCEYGGMDLTGLKSTP